MPPYGTNVPRPQLHEQAVQIFRVEAFGGKRQMLTGRLARRSADGLGREVAAASSGVPPSSGPPPV
ncbi:hypothetical protein GCM10010349_07000 [Streptomyces flavofungini]|nr:hypothetical protein GCM10010349_07000 [Streptomyces flavofungini]